MPATEEVLHQWYLVVDGNAHRPDLCADQVGFTASGMLSEAMLPAIRSTACLIAAMRHDLNSSSPDTFTEEADWFAARILVLSARVFHLDVSLFPMLNLANERAQAFARRHNLAFTPARARMSLHAGRPGNMLIMQLPHRLPASDLGLVGNSLAMKQQINA
ncbi:MAG: hypothetical protein Q4G42_04330 [Neisseria sp.]|nr:hypothetical protein [Neisseria sp.]